ncbi:MAG TPA: lamin tail domain-containing protein [Verrucomicrobiae bacterium]|nr:lamin tail domain-containing protein [Verrucomicrobiae bacterium]
MIRSSVVFILLSVLSARAACDVCTSFEPGTNWGTVTSGNIREASGIAASARNPGVLWTHNDGPRSRIFALSTNGALLATYNFSQPVDDFEDVAVGGGYVYMGDIGGSQSLTGTRSSIRILRAPEPPVNLEWAVNPVSIDLGQVEVFTLPYPDGSYDAETVWFDSVSNAVYVVTKDPSSARIYRADLQASTLEFVTSLNFPLVSGGDISADGSKIALRREHAALLWGRCDGEPIADALARTGIAIPVIGPPTEPNGEGIGFLRDGTGYVTISEGQNQPIYFFQATCPMPPRFTLPLSDLTGILGGSVRLSAYAVGYPPPVFEWLFKGDLLTDETNSLLNLSTLAPAQGGLYQLTASNAHGKVTTEATLTIITKPDLRITEVESAPTSPAGVTTADWWELTSFERQPVSLGGWRFNDNAGGLTDPFVFPQGLTIHPGESLVLAEGITEAQFRAWWGIPLDVRVVTYAGNGLGFGAAGDGIRLWNNFTTDPLDTVASVNFGSATTGVTFNYNPMTGQFGGLSQLGVNGVFRAAAAPDVGSPGRILSPPASPQLKVSRNNSSLQVTFNAEFGRRYSLEVLDSTGWSPTGDVFEANANTQASFEKPISLGNRFFRVRVD